LGKIVMDSYFINPERILPNASNLLLGFITRSVILRLQLGSLGMLRSGRTGCGRRATARTG